MTARRMISGEVMSFADEAEALFGIRPELRPLSSYDPVLAEIDALLPGEGSLTDRVTAFKSHYIIPRDRLQVVMDAAIAECRRRTAYIPQWVALAEGLPIQRMSSLVQSPMLPATRLSAGGSPSHSQRDPAKGPSCQTDLVVPYAP